MRLEVCDEFIQDVRDWIRRTPFPAGVTRNEAVVGLIAQVFLHKTGHALFLTSRRGRQTCNGESIEDNGRLRHRGGKLDRYA
jgi:hypothetical protein